MSEIESFEDRIRRLDVSLFQPIESESSEFDQLSWLSLQRIIRTRSNGYVYLEIGSHLGGSIQQHLLDPSCRKIYSIDPRPLQQPDDRGDIHEYESNSTARMLKNLEHIAPGMLHKVQCFDKRSAEVDPGGIAEPPDYCLIDGEHTREAVLIDFDFCLSVCKQDGVIVFHDDRFIVPAIKGIVRSLSMRRIRFTARKFGGSTFAVFLRDGSSLADDPHIRKMSLNGIRLASHHPCRIVHQGPNSWLAFATRTQGLWPNGAPRSVTGGLSLRNHEHPDDQRDNLGDAKRPQDTGAFENRPSRAFRK